MHTYNVSRIETRGHLSLVYRAHLPVELLARAQLRAYAIVLLVCLQIELPQCVFTIELLAFTDSYERHILQGRDLEQNRLINNNSHVRCYSKSVRLK